MAVFENLDQGFGVLGMDAGAKIFEFTFQEYTGPTGSYRTIFSGQWDENDGSGDGYIYQAPSSNSMTSSGVSDIRLNGLSINTFAPVDVTGDDLLSALVSGHGGDFMAFNRYSLDEPIHCEVTAVTIKSADGSTVLHTFDLSNPTSANVPDTTGSAIGELKGFNFSLATISSVDGDNDVTQYQLVLIDVANFTEMITYVQFGSEPVVEIPDNDPTDDVIQVRVPGSLATGTYDVTASGATESATISGVTYSQTHPVNLPAVSYDSNSLMTGQKLGSGYAGDAYMNNPAVPYEIDGPGGSAVPSGAVMSFKSPYTDWTDVPVQNDVNDYLEAPVGFVGWMRRTFSRIYSDGTMVSWAVEFEVKEGGVIVSNSGLFRTLFDSADQVVFKTLFR